MADYGKPTPAGGENLYDDAPDSDGAPAAEPKEDEGGETALVPKSLCPGMKPGDELVLKIVAVQEDQYQVAYESKDEESSEPAEPPQGDSEMAGMMT